MRTDLKWGLVAGTIATLPMTVAFKALNRKVPEEERLPIPPKEVGNAIAERTGIAKALDTPKHRKALIWLGHYGYGAASGTIFPDVARSLHRRFGIPFSVAGAGFGLAVWAGSYLGWLPAARLLPRETRRPGSRMAVNVAAHLVWGAVLGTVFGLLARTSVRR